MSQLKEIIQLSFNSTSDSYQTFGLDIVPTGTGVQQVVLQTSADVYVDFDYPATSTTGFFIPAANTAATVLDFRGGSIMTVHARGKTGSGTLYIIGIRN